MKAINTFDGGVVQVIDPHKQRSNTMRYALNGRIMYNSFANAGDVGLGDSEGGSNFFGATRRGMSFAFSNERGTKKISEVCQGYEIVGMADAGEYLIVISTTGSSGNAQIGILSVLDDLSSVQYKILFDDKNDPNGDKLRIKKFSEPNAQEVKIIVTGENIYTKRIYFNDGYNQERCLNLMLCYQQTQFNPSSCENITNLTPIHTNSQVCGESSVDYQSTFRYTTWTLEWTWFSQESSLTDELTEP